MREGNPYEERYYPYPLERRPDRYRHGHGFRGPWYQALDKFSVGADAGPVCRYWPVLTPDHGIFFCSTEDDAYRVATDMNLMLDRIAVLEGWLGLLYRRLPEHERGNFPKLRELIETFGHED